MKKILFTTTLLAVLTIGQSVYAQGSSGIFKKGRILEQREIFTEISPEQKTADMVDMILELNEQGMSRDDIVRTILDLQKQEKEKYQDGQLYINDVPAKEPEKNNGLFRGIFQFNGQLLDREMLQASVSAINLFPGNIEMDLGNNGNKEPLGETTNDDMLDLLDMDTSLVNAKIERVWIEDPTEPGGGYWDEKNVWIEPCYVICIYEENRKLYMTCQEYENTWKGAQREIDPGCPNHISRKTGKPIGYKTDPRKIDPRIGIGAESAKTLLGGSIINDINNWVIKLRQR